MFGVNENLNWEWSQINLYVQIARKKNQNQKDSQKHGKRKKNQRFLNWLSAKMRIFGKMWITSFIGAKTMEAFQQSFWTSITLIWTQTKTNEQ